MKQLIQNNNIQLLKKSFVAGTIITFCIYAIIRIIFYEFTFTAAEEIIMFIKIELGGGAMVAAFFSFLLITEIVISKLLKLKPINHRPAVESKLFIPQSESLKVA